MKPINLILRSIDHRMRMPLLMVVLAWSIPAVALANIDVSELEYWAARVNARSFAELLSDLEHGPPADWPEVVSAQYASPMAPSERQKQQTFRDLATVLVQKLQSYELSSAEQDDAEFTKRLTALIALRDHIARRSSYVNWVLVDAINRKCLVALAKYVCRPQMGSASSTLSSAVGAFHLDMKLVAGVAEKELGRTVLTPEELQSSDDVEIFKAVWQAVAPGQVFPYASSLGHAGTYDLVKARHLELLLVRYVLVTDFYIHAAIPRTILYRAKVGESRPSDDFRRILAATKDEKTVPSLSERVIGRELGFHAASFLFNDVNTGTIDRYLCF